MSIKQNIRNTVVKLFGGVPQDETLKRSKKKIITEGMPELARQVAAEGTVLLENSVLPLNKGEKISVFGRIQLDYFYAGYGSGGDVNTPYTVSPMEGFGNCEDLIVNENLANIYSEWVKKHKAEHGGWGTWPHFHPEMPLSSEQVANAREFGERAVIFIGRSSGEDRECLLEKGSYYISDLELDMVKKVTDRFEKPILIFNFGCIMDMSWLEPFKDKLGAIIIAWQGGMESGNALADILSGKASPSGRLTDTIAKDYIDYPSSANFGKKEFLNYEEDIYVGYRWFETFDKDSVIYPFGYGLSYTDFEVSFVSMKERVGSFEFTVKVKNVGDFASKETVCIYLEKPCGKLGNPSRSLVAFAKTKTLNSNEEEILLLKVEQYALSSFDDSGITGHTNSYVIEEGGYSFYLGGDVRSANKIYEYGVESDLLFRKVEEVAAPREPFEVIMAVEENGERVAKKVPVTLAKKDLKKEILDNLPKGLDITGDKGYLLSDVKVGKISMDEFVAQFSLDELEVITRGDFTMNSPQGAKGNVGVFGGTIPSLHKKGIPPISTNDGPSGIRLYETCSLIPIGALLAATFDYNLVKEIHVLVGREMNRCKSDVLLSPGMNIHRNPLCGRNFEYYSEDPYLSGMIAAASVEGVQSTGVSACPKHFACNNQELNRTKNDSRVSGRALREIYVKGFEICINKAKPMNIMTSYNKINGVWAHYHYELCTNLLREEWGYEGNVMTDWWMQHGSSPEFSTLRDSAYRVRSQVDVLMPGGWHFKPSKVDNTLLETYGKEDGITLGEMQRCAKNVLRFVMDSPAFEREK